ncbi:MAG: OmpA family protein [Crocinitomicaceae bacterium]
MKQLMKNIRPKVVLIAAFVFLGIGAWSQMSYEEFHAKYEPHNNTITPDLKAVTVVNESDAETGALIAELLMQKAEEGDEDSRLKIIAILSSSKRKKVADILKTLSTDRAVDFMNYINYDWQYEVMYFVDKTTYHNLASNLLSMLIYTGPKGPFGPKIGNWSPAYAGLGFDAGWSGMKGFNNVITNYGDLSKQNWMKGPNVMVGFRTKGMKFIEIMYQNRGLKTDYENPSFTNVTFNQHTVGVNILKGKGNDGAPVLFTHGWGLHANFASWSTKSESGKTKVGSGINGGLSYNAQLFINPLKNVPVMFGLRGYGQLNLPTYDFNGLNDELQGNPAGTSANKDNKSVISSFGFQAQVLYKFGKAKDDRVFKDFDTEVSENMDPHVNTVYTEILPIVSPDGNTLYFIRSDHPMNNKGSMNTQDVWYADISGGLENAKAHRMPPPFNTGQNNMIAGVSPDGNSMMIKGIYENGALTGESGYSTIYKTATGWSTPEKVNIKDYKDMTKGAYIGGYWTQDGKHIVLSFSEKSDNDHQDLYITHKQEDGSWSRPVSLGKTINTDGDEHSPFLASDGRTLYFSSDREGAIGSNDIWMTQREGKSWTNWSEPINLGSEINTEEWDAYYTIDAQGKYAYMASSKNSKGKNDIVRIKLKEEVQPDPVVLIRGKVLNKKTNDPLDAIIAYNDLIGGENHGVARTNPATGEYMIVLPYGKNYDFTAGAANFIGISENLDLTGVGEYQEIERDLYLVPIEIGATVRMNNIFFETGKAELKTESFSELNRVIKFLDQNPNVKIELSGHTDNVGNDALNKSLSQKRADAVLTYLTQNGVEQSRLVAKGYGMEKPIADNATEDGRAHNRRVEFTILEN